MNAINNDFKYDKENQRVTHIESGLAVEFVKKFLIGRKVSMILNYFGKK